MKSTFFTFLSLFLLFACKKEIKSTSEDWQIISENVQFKEDGNNFLLKSGKFNYSIPTSKLPYKKVILLNASLVGYFTELNLEQNIIGISSPEYVYSEKVHQLIDEGKIENVGNEQKYNLEKIIALKPDVIFTNYIASFENTYDLIKKNGIEIIFLDEYLEQNPLEKSKYLLVFGELFNNEKKAISKLEKIRKSYDSLKTLAKTAADKPIVLANEMYGSQWFLPGGKSNLAQFISDANATYINADNNDTKAIPMSFEEVFAKGQKAEYWVNIGNHENKKELLQINPNYTKFPVFNSGKLYTITGRTNGKSNDYFESGVVRADIVLKDYLKIFHPELLPNYQLTYLRELK
ncbi:MULTISPECIES: ABC transporter substrate-binding protein [unclassified Kaistella]|uniref:ABC transporter substrate-binding protein n=1 Tax=unclassified Kaistella TaxID=2762626 RepID=UPI002733B71C|nr:MULTISPECIES: ABC transporter substrate-binding protein [unclassified Kaistella]MDP2454588.1 ABC transporter substrate-binding protein [Kaistella sp. SH11-4b]MDP2457325.1 ABC transporter substrate-binding protein [Kaistella sp. SH40-3]MDP2460085.1 ABC transporter substrate-binding protein [Kaistella sp. SH19-2b]